MEHVVGIAHTRISLIGKVSSGGDSWSCGFSTPPELAPDMATMEHLAARAGALFGSSFWTPVFKPIAGASTDVRGARAAAIAADGHTIVSGEFLYATPSGGNLDYSLPPEVAVCVSLRTTTPGPRGRGRMYLPPLSPDQLDNRGGLNLTVRDGLAAGMAAFLSAWNADPDTKTASVASNVGIEVSAVTAVKVGNVFDSQRRRRDRLVEFYKQAAVTI